MNLNKLNAKIVEQGFSKKELAKHFNISVQAMSKKLKGTTRITADDAIEFCSLLNITDSEEKCKIFL